MAFVKPTLLIVAILFIKFTSSAPCENENVKCCESYDHDGDGGQNGWGEDGYSDVRCNADYKECVSQNSDDEMYCSSGEENNHGYYSNSNDEGSDVSSSNEKECQSNQQSSEWVDYGSSGHEEDRTFDSGFNDQKNLYSQDDLCYIEEDYNENSFSNTISSHKIQLMTSDEDRKEASENSWDKGFTSENKYDDYENSERNNQNSESSFSNNESDEQHHNNEFETCLKNENSEYDHLESGQRDDYKNCNSADISCHDTEGCY